MPSGLCEGRGTTVCEISCDVFFGATERDLVDPVVDFGQLLLGEGGSVHSNYFKL